MKKRWNLLRYDRITSNWIEFIKIKSKKKEYLKNDKITSNIIELNEFKSGKKLETMKSHQFKLNWLKF